MTDDPSAPLPASETSADFAADLRHLRIEAGNPTLAALSRTTGVSKTVLSEAFAGRRTPSARTVAALADAFGVDRRALVRRRDAVESTDDRSTGDAVSPTHDDQASPTHDEPLSSTDTAVRAGWRGSRVWLIAAASFAAGAVLSGLVTGSVISSRDSTAQAEAVASASAAPRIIVKTGQDPADTQCVNDAVVAASATRTHDTQLQIVWSAACDAAWARITRYDGKSTGNEVSTAIYRKIAPRAGDRQSTTEPDAQSAYTTLIVRPTPDTELCAVGSITVSGQTIDLGEPLCL